MAKFFSITFKFFYYFNFESKILNPKWYCLARDVWFYTQIFFHIFLNESRILNPIGKWSGIRDLKLLEPILAHLFGRCSGLRVKVPFPRRVNYRKLSGLRLKVPFPMRGTYRT